MSRIVNAIRGSTFLKHNAIFFFGALATGALNYLFYPIMARLLDTSSFGEVQALFSLFAQINIFLSVLGLITINIVVNNPAGQKRNQLILEIEKLALVLSLVLMVVSFWAGPALRHFFHFASVWPFVALSAAVVATVPLTFRSAYLRGHKTFGLVSVVNIVAAAADLVFSVVLVALHGKTTGVMVGLVVAQFLTFVLAAMLARNRSFTGSQFRTLLKLPDIRALMPELRYAALVLVSSLVITGMYSIDTVVIKHWFDAYTAGLYAGIATIARIIFFVTASIAQVLLPSVRMSQSARHNRQILLKSLVLLVGVGGSALLLFSFAPHLVVRSLMGSRFLPYAFLLPRLSVVVFSISVLNLFVLYHLALRRYAIAGIAALGATVTAGFMMVNHQSPQAIVNDLLYGCTAVGGMLGVWVAMGLKRTAELNVEPAEVRELSS